MLGRILCWIGWHDWRYDCGASDHIHRTSKTRLVRHLNNHTIYYRCVRCGEQP